MIDYDPIRIEDRSDIEEGKTFKFQSEMRPVILRLSEGDVVRVEESTNAQYPEEPLKVVEDNLEEVRVEEYGSDDQYVLSGIHIGNELEGPKAWVRTLPERESAGRVEALRVISLKEEDR
jgi:hypothetical protein